MEKNISVFMTGLDEMKKPIVFHVRELALQLVEKTCEDIKWNALCLFKGDRPFVGILPYKQYVSVIFDRGTELDDPDKMLEGKGKHMRHIKLRTLDDIEKKHVARYIKQSFALK